MDLNKKEKELSPEKLTQFVHLLCRLDELEVIGLTNLMGVSIMDGDKRPRNFEEVLSEIINSYIIMDEKKRKKIDFVLHEVVLGEEDVDCGRAKKKRHGLKRKKK